MKYQELEMNIIRYSNEDIVRTSDGGFDGIPDNENNKGDDIFSE